MAIKDALRQMENQDAALLMAMAVIRDRVCRLPKDDRNDLYELVNIVLLRH